MGISRLRSSLTTEIGDAFAHFCFKHLLIKYNVNASVFPRYKEKSMSSHSNQGVLTIDNHLAIFFRKE